MDQTLSAPVAGEPNSPRLEGESPSRLIPRGMFAGGMGAGAGEESILRYYWNIVFKRRWVILGVLLFFVLAAIVYSLLSQKQYSATVTLEIAREAARVVEMGESQPRSGMDPEFYQTQYSLLQSRSLAEAVVRDLRLAENADFLTGYSGAAASELPRDRAQRTERAVQTVMGNTAVMPVRLSGVVNVRHTSPNPQMAAAIANSLAENFIQSTLGRRFEASAYARTFLENRLGQLRQRLEESERQAVNYASQNRIVNVQLVPGAGESRPAEQPLIVASLAAANAALQDARTMRITAENRYRNNSSSSNEPLGNIALNEIRQQTAVLRGQYERLLADFGPEYPQVRALRAQVEEMERQLASQSGRVQSGVRQLLRAQYQEALASERQQVQRVDDLTAQLLEVRRRSIQYNIFQREVDTNRTLYDALLQRYKEVGVAGGVGINNVSVVDRAIPPNRPVSPNLRINVLLGLLLGLVAGVIAAIVLEQLDESTILPQDVHKKLGVPLLGTIPISDRGIDPKEALADRKSTVSEAYFSVLTALHFSTSHGTPKSLMVTSTQPSEGKSTTAYAIAQALSRLGGDVLLIDADMRNPSLHRLMKLSKDSGLSNILVGEGDMLKLAQSTDSPHLWLLPAGPIPPNPAELLAGAAFRQAIVAAGSRFAHIVVDGPPMLGLADAPLIASSVEASVFIMEWGRTKASQARNAVQRLNAAGSPIAGVVVTKFNQQRAGYGYGYGYDYDYGENGNG